MLRENNQNDLDRLMRQEFKIKLENRVDTILLLDRMKKYLKKGPIENIPDSLFHEIEKDCDNVEELDLLCADFDIKLDKYEHLIMKIVDRLIFAHGFKLQVSKNKLDRCYELEEENEKIRKALNI